MTSEKDNIDRAYIEPNEKIDLFSPLNPHPGNLGKTYPRDVCNEIGLNVNTADDLYREGLLSFNPITKHELDVHEEIELRFVGSIAASIAACCSASRINWFKVWDEFLKDLRSPYCYRIERMYFDWLRRKWELLPSAPVFDEKEDIIDAIQDTIDTLQRGGNVDELRSLYEHIEEALGTNQRDYRNSIIAGIAKRECEKISKTVIYLFESMTEGMQSGDDSSLKNLWDEICVQVRGQESFFWNFYLDMISGAIHSEVNNLDDEIKQAIWLQTDGGKDWETDNKGNEVAIFWENDIIFYIQQIILSAADNCTNEGIEKYLEGEYDDPNIG